MEVIEKLVKWDWKLSIAINGFNSDWADAVMMFLSNRLVWIPFYVLMVVWLFGLYKKKAVWILLGVAALIAVADWTSVHWFKLTVERLRPCHDPMWEDLLHTPAGCGGRYGFVSSHAVNHFAMAVFLTPWFSRLYGVRHQWSGKVSGAATAWQRWQFGLGKAMYGGLAFFFYGGLYIWAALIGYSRVYLAAHYLGDVICGGLWGALLGLLFYLGLRRFILPRDAGQNLQATQVQD